MDFLNQLDAEVLKTELLVFLENGAYDPDEDLAEQLVEFIKEDFSNGDIEV